jgi:hypothetical protein
MSNGVDFAGASRACHAARRNIREMQAEEDSAKAHFKRAEKESQNAVKAETLGDGWRHTMEEVVERQKGDEASHRADEHRKEAFQHLAEYNAKMGRDPRKGTPALGNDGPDCTMTDAAKGVADALRGMGRRVP